MARGEFEVYLAVDAPGDYAVGTEQEDAVERYNDSIGGTGPLTVYRLVVDVELPEAIDVHVTIPAGTQPVATVRLSDGE